METTRKPFVAPQLKEEASLVGVTLISGKGCNRRGFHGVKRKKGNQSIHRFGHNRGRSA